MGEMRSTTAHRMSGDYPSLTGISGSRPVENPADEALVYCRHDLEERIQGLHGSSVSRRPGDARTPSTSHRQPAVDPGVHVAAASRLPRVLIEIYTGSHLVFFSLLGTLSRIGLRALTNFPGSPVAFGTLWANFAGTAVLGFVAEFSGLRRRRLRRRAGENSGVIGIVESNSRLSTHDVDGPAVGRPSPLYVGLTVGFCGSFTSFSGFMGDAFVALFDSAVSFAEGTGTPRLGTGRNIQVLLALTILTVCACLSALKFGAHVAVLLGNLDLLQRHLPLRHVDRVMVVLALGSWSAVVLMTLLPPDRPGGPVGVASWDQETWRQVLFALVFAPLGCLLRFHLSIKLNAVSAVFPWGTFAANVVGTAVLGMVWDLQHAPLVSGVASKLSCQVLPGVVDGFCGCLTTVSTWVTELNSLRRVHAYVYGAATIVLSFVVLLAIAGTMRWTVGWADSACVKV